MLGPGHLPRAIKGALSGSMSERKLRDAARKIPDPNAPKGLDADTLTEEELKRWRGDSRRRSFYRCW